MILSPLLTTHPPYQPMKNPAVQVSWAFLATLVPFTGGSSSSDQASNDLISNLGGGLAIETSVANIIGINYH